MLKNSIKINSHLIYITSIFNVLIVLGNLDCRLTCCIESRFLTKLIRHVLKKTNAFFALPTIAYLSVILEHGRKSKSLSEAS